MPKAKAKTQNSRTKKTSTQKPRAKKAAAPRLPPVSPDPYLNVLETPFITIRTPDGMTEVSLPGLYAALARNTVDDLHYLRPHQKHPIHATLCQIGAVAMINAGLTTAPKQAERWEEILSDLTRVEFPEDQPWYLYTPGITQPAFMQPPASSQKKAAEYRKVLESPDTMDITVGSKRHDVKDGVVRRPRAEHWFYALVTSQAASGFEGNRLYGNSRMNGGLSNRHGFSVTPGTRWGIHTVRDMDLLAQRYQSQNVSRHLLWTRAWDGEESETIKLEDLQPMALYVEACKRIRLIAQQGGEISHALRAGAKATRINSKETNGITQDPWMLTETGKAVTVSRNGFGYREISRYLEPERYFLPELATARASDGDTVILVARTMARGQGKTEGYHEQEIPLRELATSMMRTRNGQEDLGAEATERANCVREVSSILRHAVKTYLQGGRSSGEATSDHQKIIDNYSRQLQKAIEGDFWEKLQDGLESEDPRAARAEWTHRTLVPRARKVLGLLQATALCPAQTRFMASALSEELFWRRTNTNRRLPKRPQAETSPQTPAEGEESGTANRTETSRA